MFKKVDMYIVICDRCGKNASEDNEYSDLESFVWADKEAAWDDAREGDYEEINDKHYCSDCWVSDEDGELAVRGEK